MSRFFNSFFSGKNARPTHGKFAAHISKKTLKFESLEERRVMHCDSLEIQAPIVSSEAPICTAMTLEEFTAKTGIVIDEGVVMKLPAESGDGQIKRVDGPDLVIDTLPPNLFEPVKGDADSDGDIDLDDLAVWDANFTGDLGGRLANPVKTFAQGDFDGDGDTDLNDLGWWSINYTGPDDDVVQPEPEPTLIGESEASADDSTALGTEPANAEPEIAVVDGESDDVSAEAIVEDDSSFRDSESIVISPVAGDGDFDGDIDNDDLAIWDANFTGDLNTSEFATKLFGEGDFDGDGDVDLNDLGLWAVHYTGPIEIGNA